MIWLVACTEPAPVPEVEPTCPPLSGLETERELRFEVHDEADVSAGGWVRTVTRQRAVATVVDEGSLVADEEVAFRTEDDYRCDEEGVWWIGHAEELEASVETAHHRVDWSAPPLVLTWELAVGDSWEGEQVYVRSSDGHEDAPATEAYEVEVVAGYLLTIQAGTFEVLDVRLNGHPSFRTVDLGEVRTDRAELVSWRDIE